VPVERDQAVLADRLPGGQVRQVLVDALSCLGGGLVVFRRDAVLGEPAEDVAHTGLAGLVAPEPVDDATVHHAAHARDLMKFGAVHDVAGGGAHDGHELARLHGLRCRRGDVRVHVADGDGDALREPGPGGCLGGQVAGGVT
jgi:hypothetical protein